MSSINNFFVQHDWLIKFSKYEHLTESAKSQGINWIEIKLSKLKIVSKATVIKLKKDSTKRKLKVKGSSGCSKQGVL